MEHLLFGLWVPKFYCVHKAVLIGLYPCVLVDPLVVRGGRAIYAQQLNVLWHSECMLTEYIYWEGCQLSRVEFFYIIVSLAVCLVSKAVILNIGSLQLGYCGASMQSLYIYIYIYIYIYRERERAARLYKFVDVLFGGICLQWAHFLLDIKTK